MSPAMAVPIWLLDFGAGPGPGTAVGDTLQWAWSATPAAGPVGEASWGTVPDANYLHEADDSLVFDLPPLGGASRPVLVVDHWYQVDGGDRAVVEVDDGGGWVTVTPLGGYPDADGFVGSSGGWRSSVFDLSGTSDPARLRLRLSTDVNGSDDGWYLRGLQVIDGDAAPPVIQPLLPLGDTQDLAGPWPVRFLITDDVAVVEARLVLEESSGATSWPLTEQGGEWVASIDPLPLGSTATWQVEADDGTQTARYPEPPATFRVFLAAPTGLRDLDGGPRSVRSSVRLAWDPPESPTPPTSYVLRQEGRPDVEVPATEVTVGLSRSDTQIFTVSARFDAQEGDPSAPLITHVEVPALGGLVPGTGFAGQELYLTLHGEALYLGVDTVPSLGPGVEVVGFEVVDVDRGVLRVAIDPDATWGPRDLSLEGPFGELTFADAFDVEDPAGAPRVVGVEPASLEQGEERTLTVTVSEPFARADLRVEGGDDLIVTSVEAARGDTVQVRVAAGVRARIGDHPLLLDDGLRLWSTAVEVTEYRSPPQRNCAHGGGVGVAGWLLAMVGLRRRRS